MTVGDQQALPARFIYRDYFLSQQEENELLRNIGTLDFEMLEFRGFTAKRRVIAYGWSYDFNSNATLESKK